MEDMTVHESPNPEPTPTETTDPEVQKERPTSIQQREKWANKMEFLLSMAGEIIGLGNVWRFPYLCYKNGGGVFFIPYFVFLVFCGIPIFFLETALGQYTSEGGITAWRKICPMFEGIGFASQVIVCYLNIYYIVVLAWGLFYFFSSFRSPLAWTTCSNEWNTFHCRSSSELFNHSSSLGPAHSSEEEFWEHRVLRVKQDDFQGSLGKVNYDLALCLLLAWIVCYFCIWKGVKSTGKAVYFTATFPYLMLIILVIRGVTLPGAAEGIKYYLFPDLSKLANPEVWLAAGTQVFFSYAVCQGVLTALGSYNKYNNNCYKDCVGLCLLNSSTSIFAGFAVFSVLGFMAHELNTSIDHVVQAGVGLAFIAYPRALALLPAAQFWSVLFFLMVIFLGLDSQFVCVESLATAITDLFPAALRKPGRREVLVLLICVICFLLGLTLVTEGGIRLFELIDTYGTSGNTLLFIACFETIAIAWVYGADRFYDNIEDMIGYPLCPALKYCWLFITPIICGGTLLYNVLFQYSENVVHKSSSTQVLSSLLIVTPMVCIPVYMLISLWRNREGIATPSSDLRQLKPCSPRLTLCGIIVLEAQKPMQRTKTEEESPFSSGESEGALG
ncbi:sodium- and chloride-dependent GABA transporter 2-like [Denticeps clupeoides]|uniref:Transporter n=1 Tax=Denticeps clupeoides TaxID=299321 RepID=A0AAY4EG67_9TELE|nr:sodium- and chloride-dependent GABA transporter 2-like [Denticeps clupeoides]XP_028809572.1 sodium- and chloride-dependent GABA transporter 2-like [Denticeps clupeoides]